MNNTLLLWFLKKNILTIHHKLRLTSLRYETSAYIYVFVNQISHKKEDKKKKTCSTKYFIKSLIKQEKT
jgi:hypothetical protein